MKLTLPEDASDTDIQKPYRELIEPFTYLAVATRLDIAFIASSLSQFNNSYSNIYWTADKCVLRYLKGMIDLDLVYEADANPLKGFVDADWGNCLVDTGYIFILSECAVSWEIRVTDVVVFNDNLGAKKLADNLMYHSRSKHIDLRHHFEMHYIQDSCGSNIFLQRT
ncbi:Copia protein [Trachymyrmex septentrionalis]|uniref:Copia protein n=1 Tax=Trachymyrmex septentrionalis TaxID=34720 RepID=A0A151K0S8_9HYME|nr:Copia protein [Trachymyrmex septentrionalis]